MSGLRVAWAIAAKDLKVEARGRYAVGMALPFAATLLIAFGLSLGPGRTLLEATAPGLLWLAVLFAVTLLARRSYEAEAEDGALEGLVLAPLDKAAVFAGKTAALTLQLLAVEAAVLAMVTVLFGLPLGGDALALAATLALGTLGLAAVGGLFGVLTVMPRAREAVLPLLVMPLASPVLIAGVRATALATAGRAGEAGSWLGLLVAFDVVLVAAGTLVFEHLVED
ncbi:MAG TPA: heme exporter protein CcmB [Actinomycetota bacterium]|nr:heme exporter protein CcmB [Actinomycetota bacterium]